MLYIPTDLSERFERCALQVKQLQMMSEEVTRSAHTEANKAASEVKRVEQLDQECRAARARADAAEDALEQVKRALAQRDADASSLRSEKDRLHAQVEQARALCFERAFFCTTIGAVAMLDISYLIHVHKIL